MMKVILNKEQVKDLMLEAYTAYLLEPDPFAEWFEKTGWPYAQLKFGQWEGSFKGSPGCPECQDRPDIYKMRKGATCVCQRVIHKKNE